MPLALPQLMRQNTTANIARSFAPKPPPVIGFTPGPQPVEHIDPIYPPGARTGANPTNPAAMSYLALMRSAGRPVQPGFTPQGRELGQEPALPGDSGPPEPTPIPEPPMSHGPHPDPYGIDPSNSRNNPFYDWPNYRGNQDFNPPRLGGVSYPPGYFDDDYTSPRFGDGPPDSEGGNSPRFNANPNNPNEWQFTGTNGPRRYLPGGGPGTDTGGPGAGSGPTFSGGPHIPSTGGRVGAGTTDPRPWYNQRTEPWYGRLARALIPYGAGQFTHIAADVARRMALRGTVGGAAHVAGGRRTTPAATGPAQMTGPVVSPAARPTSVNHWDFTRGAYVPNNYAGGAANNPHASMIQVMNSTLDGGRPNRNLVNDNLLTANAEHGPMFRGAMTPAARAAFAQMYGARGVHTRDIYAGGG